MALSDFYPQMKNWTPAQPVPNTPAAGPSQSPTTEVPSSPYLRTTIPLPLQYTPDTLKQYNRQGLSTFRIAPLPPGGNPAVNSASSSVINSSINQFVNVAAAGPNGAVQFNNGGALAGVSQFEWDNISSALSVTGDITASIFNATTGFEISGGATSGHYLRGNGTNFISAILSGSDIATGLVPLAYGGTDADLSLTGGAHQVLRQSTVGGAVTVSQLSYSDISGSLVTVPIWRTISQTSNYNAVAGDMVLADTSGGGFTVTLPASASNANLSIRVKKVSSDTNQLIIARSGSDVIDGQTSQTITGQYTNIEMTADGSTNWWVA